MIRIYIQTVQSKLDKDMYQLLLSLEWSYYLSLVSSQFFCISVECFGFVAHNLNSNLSLPTKVTK